MAFPPAFIDELIARNPIEDVVGQYVSLKRSGSNLFGLCPFHSEKTPSFTVYPESRSYYCFGCQNGGDAIYLVDQLKDDRVSEDEWVRDLSIKNAIDHLQQREQRIIRQRFFMGKTQMEVADEIGISQAQVSRLEKAALKQMQRYI